MGKTIEIADKWNPEEIMADNSSAGVRAANSHQEKLESFGAFTKVIFYIVLGAISWKGLIITYNEAYKAFVKARYTYITSFIHDQLKDTSYGLTTKMNDNKKYIYDDLTKDELSMAIYVLKIRNSQLESMRNTINEMTVGIEVVREENEK